MRSDSDLQICTFRSEKQISLLMQSDIVAKSDEMNSDLRIRWPKPSDLSDDSTCRILKSKNGIGRLSSSKDVTEHSLVHQQYEFHADVRVTIAMRWTTNTTTTRERSRRVSPLYI